ncbi:hypothetical protein CCR75_006463 [Bremia lactucae]|uniref:Uncharacterized protein n=1 Tax=Bremia lactucae TaxID=4779 RepID=A0A976IEX8_BRELC|nr:hypothetical protein CCR75_006463 [Bremia lactucae]
MRRAANGDATVKARGGSKLRASRARARNGIFAGEQLEQQFGRASLSESAPEFVPSAQPSVPMFKRSMAFVTERRDMSKSAISTGTSRRTGRLMTATAAHLRKKIEPAAKQQQMMASKGSKAIAREEYVKLSNKSRLIRTKNISTQERTQPTAKTLGVFKYERRRRKLSLTSSELQSQEVFVIQKNADAETVIKQEIEVYPESSPSAFPQQLALFSQQKRLPQRVASRDDVINTIFKALFTGSKGKCNRPRQVLSAFGDDTGTDTDEPNEDFVKRGLASALFKDQLNLHMPSSLSKAVIPAVAADNFITPKFMHALMNALRFEDFRVASARLEILRAIRKTFSTKRLHLSRALADAIALRLEYVQSIETRAQTLGVEISSNKVIADHLHDHGHGFVEFLRYSIEHIEENLVDTPPLEGSDAARELEEQRQELVRNCLASLVSLWRAHWIDPAGSDEDELISCAGQFVAYMPSATGPLLKRLLNFWPTRFPKQEVCATRMVARVIMSGLPLHQVDSSLALQRRVFKQLARILKSPHVDAAKEALAFTGCQFVLVHFLKQDKVIYEVITAALHVNIESHWHSGVRNTSATHFDRALDFAS